MTNQKLTAPQARFLAKLVVLRDVDGHATFKVIDGAIWTFDAERQGWYPKVMFGRGERVAFEGLFRAGAVRHVGATALDVACEVVS